MTTQRGDYVRPNNPSVGLPFDSVWRVSCSAGSLKLEPENGFAQRVGRGATYGRRFSDRDFDKVVLCRGQWVDAQTASDYLRYPTSFFDDEVLTGRMSSQFPSPQNLPRSMFTKARPDAVSTATIAAEQAANATAAIGSLLEAARKLEAEREAEVQAAKRAKAKADKEAAAKAKAEEARRQLAARLCADRCLACATLALIAEVSRLSNGGAEQIAEDSIAAHVGQLQALAKSYGYRIVKPSVIAIVVKA